MKRSVNFALSVLFFCAAAALGCFRIIDTDLWLYLRTGEEICRTMRVPRVDLFSCSAYGRPWIDVHWLAQAALWLVYSLGGAAGLSLLRLAVVLAIAAVLYRTCRTQSGVPGTVFTLTLSLCVAQDGFLMKPHLFSLLLAVIFVSILEGAATAPHRRLWLLLPLQVVWANIHPSFILGPGLIAVYAADACLRRKRRRDLVALVPCAILACLANPYGIALFAQPWAQLSNRLFNTTVIPWTKAPSTFPLPVSVPAFRLMLGIGIAAMAIEWRRTRPAHLCAVAIFAVLALKSRRHMPLFALLCAPAISCALSGCALRFSNRLPRFARAMAAAPAVALVAGLCLLLQEVTGNTFYYRQRSAKRFGLGKSLIAYPDGALAFVESSGRTGCVFCNYDVGSYCAGRLYPRSRVFIDGRNLVYGEGILREYLDAMGDADLLTPLTRRYGIDTLLLSHNARDVKALLPSLWESDAWRPVYADARAIVFFSASTAG
ncbi:MAG: hypothetical protein NT045_00350, partial [Candidatus Aureabacteria bacterium]|nr:hypothetical protein [Candidatus Auribacterota bacterium]